MLSCSDWTMRSSPPACARPRGSSGGLDEPRRDLLLVHRLQKAIERGLREQQAQKQPEQPIEPRRADVLGAAALIAGRAADAGRDAAHLEAARVQPLEARARVGRQALEHRDERHRRRRGRAHPRGGLLPAGVDLGVDGRAEPRHRDEAGEIGQLAGCHERQQDAGKRASARRRPRRRGRTAGST